MWFRPTSSQRFQVGGIGLALQSFKSWAGALAGVLALAFSVGMACAEPDVSAVAWAEPDGHFTLFVDPAWQRSDYPAEGTALVLPTWRIAGVPETEFRCRAERQHVNNRRATQADINALTSRHSFQQLVGSNVSVVEQISFSQEQIDGVQIAFASFRSRRDDGSIVQVREITFALASPRGLDAYKVKCVVADSANADAYLQASDTFLRSIAFGSR